MLQEPLLNHKATLIHDSNRRKSERFDIHILRKRKKIPNKSFQFEGEQEFKAGTRDGKKIRLKNGRKSYLSRPKQRLRHRP